MAVNEVKLTFTKVCQMSDNPNGKPTNILSEEEGYGSGGMRCTESCNAMIGWEWDLGACRSQWKTAEDFMYVLVEQRNNGSDVSTGRNGQEVVDWVDKWGPAKGVTKMAVEAATFSDIVAMVNRGHVGMAGFSDYNKLRKYSTKKSPYSWNDPDGEGHVVMVVGYNIAHQSVWVNDPLIGTDYQPSEYTFASFQAAQFNSLSEVYAPPLPGAPGGSTVAVPSGWKDNGKDTLTAPNNIVVTGDFRSAVLDPQTVLGWAPGRQWVADDWPVAVQQSVNPVEPGNPSLGAGTRQDFRMTSLAKAANHNSGKVYQVWVGNDLQLLSSTDTKDASQLAADTAQIAEMNDTINKLTAQLQAQSPQDVIASVSSILSSVQATSGALETLLKGLQS